MANQTAIEWLTEPGVDTTELVKQLQAVSDGHVGKVVKDESGKVLRTVATDVPPDSLLKPIVAQFITSDAIAKLIQEVVDEFQAELEAREPIELVGS